jgi:hypothetical protein
VRAVSYGLSQLGRRYLADPKGAVLEASTPALVWEAPAEKKDSGDVWLLTGTGGPMQRPRAGEALVLPVVKAKDSKNPFAMGVTVGRVETNDIIVDDHSVSRFHAYFQHDPKRDEWVLVDAESKNGTWLDALKLDTTTRPVVKDGSMVKFGDAAMRFLLPQSLFRYMAQVSGIPVDFGLFQGSKR